MQYAFEVNEWLIGDELSDTNLDQNFETKIIGEPEVMMTMDQMEGVHRGRVGRMGGRPTRRR